MRIESWNSISVTGQHLRQVWIHSVLGSRSAQLFNYLRWLETITITSTNKRLSLDSIFSWYFRSNTCPEVYLTAPILRLQDFPTHFSTFTPVSLACLIDFFDRPLDRVA